MKNLIRTLEENHVALLIVERLMEGDPAPESEQGKFLLFMVGAVKEYEDKKYGKI